MANTARRGTLRCIMAGVIIYTASGDAENQTALIEDVTYCSAQNSKTYGTAMIVTVRIRIAFHSLPSAGQRLFWTHAIASSSTPAANRRSANASNGGTSRTTRRIPSHVVPQIRQSETYPAS